MHFHSKNVPQAKFLSKSHTLQALWHSKTPYFQDSLEIKQKFEKLKLNCEKNQAKYWKNSRKISEKLKNCQLQLSWFVKKASKKKPWFCNDYYKLKFSGECVFTFTETHRSALVDPFFRLCRRSLLSSNNSLGSSAA